MQLPRPVPPSFARLIAGVLAVLLATTLAGPVASATPHRPTAPTAQQVRDARAVAATADRALARAQQQQDDANARLDALDAQVEALVEQWDAARADADAAAADLAAAQTRAATAALAAGSAQDDVDRLADASYQLGADLSGGVGQWASVLDSVMRSDGISGLTDRIAAVGQVAADRRQRIASATALRFAALQAQQAAASAASALAASEAAAAAAAAAVQAAQRAQQGEVARLTAERDAAALVLRAASAHASVLQRRRTAALARAEAERRAAAVRAAAEAARRLRERQGGGRPPIGSGGTRSWPAGQSSTTPAQRAAALAFAEAQLGKPYVAGGRGPDNYDCSGLTAAAYHSAGVPMIAYSKAQFAAYEKIPVSRLQPGDLVFYAFDPDDWLTIHHVGMYVGGGRMVEAPHTGSFVRYQNIWIPGLVAYGVRP